MRFELLWNPELLIERLAIASQRRRRMKRLRGTIAGDLKLGHIDSLELLDMCKPLGIGVIYDVGACIGTWAQLAMSQFPSARLEAFEPLAQHFELLQERMRTSPNASLHRVALGAENGEKPLHVTDFFGRIQPARDHSEQRCPFWPSRTANGDNSAMASRRLRAT